MVKNTVLLSMKYWCYNNDVSYRFEQTFNWISKIKQKQIEYVVAKWVPSGVNELLPEGAILAGHDQDQSPMYIGRAWHDGDQLPGKHYIFHESI